MDALQKAITLLHTGSHTCVWHKDDQTGTTSLRGVRPLVLWLRDGAVPPGACAADKVKQHCLGRVVAVVCHGYGFCAR